MNVSVKQFRQEDFVAQVRATVQHHAINPALLKLETTESVLLEKVDDTIATMNALHEIDGRATATHVEQRLHPLPRLSVWQAATDSAV